jgi:hypothetical protein
MLKNALLPVMAAAAIIAGPLTASAQTTMASPSSMMSPAAMSGGAMSHKTMMGGSMTGPDHGMPEGKMGGDGVTYTGKPDLQAAISLVTAGGMAGHFSLVKALTALAGPAVAKAEVAKLTKQYGAAATTSFVKVQNFAVDDAVAIATKAKVPFPAPMLKGKALAVRVVTLGLVGGTYYEGVQLDHLVTNAIHEQVMQDIDKKFGAPADANYHKIANQAHYDLAQALGAKTVKLAAFH